MNTQEFKQTIENAAKKIGIDLIGFASKERFDGVSAQHNPFSIFPEGKTVILVGKRICRGSLRGVEEGTNFEDYDKFGRRWLEDEFLALACYDLVRVIEDHGWEACPVFPNPSELGPQGVSVADGRPAPNVYPDFDYAAVACGLGEIGRSGLFLSPQFGSRQRFHMIITDAQIEASPLFEGSVCDSCGQCAKACPLGAIDVDHPKEIEICGKKMKVAEINYAICRSCKNGACKNRLAPSAKPDRIPALCNRTCMCHLEETSLLENRFENPFRRREAWSVGGNQT
ncbi:MAG: 4Fe-4S binding protein [Clostridia bacterium]|nr:4Fe-4S binding protein [Clostridia bacterium]